MSTEHDNAGRSRGVGDALVDESVDTPAAPALLDEGKRAAGTSPDTPGLMEADEPTPRENTNIEIPPKSPTFRTDDVLSPGAADRVFPVRSVISVQPTPPAQTPATPRPGQTEGYFPSHASRRGSASTFDSLRKAGSTKNQKGGRLKWDRANEKNGRDERNRKVSTTMTTGPEFKSSLEATPARHPPDFLTGVLTGRDTDARSTGAGSTASSEVDASEYAQSTRSKMEDTGPLMTARFKHVVTEGGHAIITGRDGETLQRCEDEPIHIPGAVQGFGLLIALEEEQEGKLVIRVVSENSKRMIGYTPKQLFALDSFTDILSDEQADNLLDHIDFIRDDDADVVANGPEVFTMSVRSPTRRNQKLWCAMHINDRHPNLVICEFELEDDQENPLVPVGEATPEPAEDTLDSQPTEEEYKESTNNVSKPLRVLRSARKRKG